MIVANSISQEGAGFQGDTNIVTILTEDGQMALEKMAKEEVAGIIVSEISNRI